MKKTIYFDNGATTQVEPKAVKAMLPYFTKKYGNASSLHSLGEEAKEALEKARVGLAETLNAKPNEIIFTSGGTESNNFAIKETAFANKRKGNHIITTKVEHKSVLNACHWLEQQGFTVTYLGVDKEGFVNLKELEEAITNKTILVSVIHGNNEVGTIQDLGAIGKICKAHNVLFHTDACQSYTKTKIDVKNIDFVTLNAHKIHGPKGIGVLYVKEGTKIKAWQHGGSHEFKLRAGTEDIASIVGFAEAAKIAMNKKHAVYISKLRDKLIKGVLKIPNVRLNGPVGKRRLCNNANFSFKAIEGEALGEYLNEQGICTSTGSACSARTLEPSYVLTAMGLTHEEANGSLRITLSRFNTLKEVNTFLKVLPGIVERLRKMSPLA